MGFPCPHCGAEEALTDREDNEIKPIIPLDLQESFKIPPPPKSDSEDSFSPPHPPSKPQPPPTRPSYAPPPLPAQEPVAFKPPALSGDRKSVV